LLVHVALENFILELPDVEVVEVDAQRDQARLGVLDGGDVGVPEPHRARLPPVLQQEVYEVVGVLLEPAVFPVVDFFLGGRVQTQRDFDSHAFETPVGCYPVTLRAGAGAPRAASAAHLLQFEADEWISRVPGRPERPPDCNCKRTKRNTLPRRRTRGAR